MNLDEIKAKWPKIYYFMFVIILLLFGFSQDKILQINSTFMTVCIFLFMGIWTLMYFVGFDFIKYLYSRYNYFKIFEQIQDCYFLSKTQKEKKEWLKYFFKRIDELDDTSFNELKELMGKIEQITRFAFPKGDE